MVYRCAHGWLLRVRRGGSGRKFGDIESRSGLRGWRLPATAGARHRPCHASTSVEVRPLWRRRAIEGAVHGPGDRGRLRSQIDLRVVGVQATRADPLAVAREHAYHGVVASGLVHSGAWAVVRYRTVPSTAKPTLGGITIIRVAPRRLLKVETRVTIGCQLSAAELARIASELGAVARSARSHVSVDASPRGHAGQPVVPTFAG